MPPDPDMPDPDMRDDESPHAACVRAWMDATVRRDGTEARIDLFQRALAALWGRAHRTLGEVTLGAIADRVLHTVSKQYPVLAAIEADASGFRFDRLRGQTELNGLDEAIELMLVQLLTVIGNLTADILTPGLHAALSGVTLETRTSASNKPASSKPPPSKPASSNPPPRDPAPSGTTPSDPAPSETGANGGTKT